MKDQFDGKIGLVTGAGSGIGRACAVALAIERGALTWLFPSEDVKEGVAAFVEKRKPQFKGK